MPLLRATGELIGVVLENARLNRESLHASLTGERQMMANEVHDSLAQSLTYMRMRMSLLHDAIRHGNELRAVKYWGDVDSSLTDAHRRLRELVTYFRSRMDPRGLQQALLDTATTFFDKTGVALEFKNGVHELHLPVGREVQVFHIVQEALANVCKHANARRARLTLNHSGDGYEIVVEDDGVGIAADPAAGDHGDVGHYGIAIMRERARRLGGELMLESAAGAGTRVRLQVPAEQAQTESTP
jgi:two-component system nitrate/nitrite sensor histidine kinase NarX